jgi:hypothetical protein
LFLARGDVPLIFHLLAPPLSSDVGSMRPRQDVPMIPAHLRVGYDRSAMTVSA